MNGIKALIAGLAIGIATTASAQDRITLKVATFTPAQTDIVTGILDPWLKRVQEASGDAFDYKIYAGGTLGRNPAEQLSLVQNGIADMAYVALSYNQGAYDEYNVAELPLLAETSRESSVGLWAALDQGLLREPEGVKVLGLWAGGMTGLHMAGDAAGLEDLSGKKLRAAGRIQSDSLAALGGVPVGNLPAPSVAEALSRGVVDGAAMTWGAVYAFRLDQVTSSHLDIALGELPVMVPINIDTWEALPQEARDAFEAEMGRDWSLWAGGVMESSVEEDLTALREDDAHTIVEFPEDQRADLGARLGKIADDWGAESDTNAAVLEAYKTAIEEYRAEGS